MLDIDHIYNDNDGFNEISIEVGNDSRSKSPNKDAIGNNDISVINNSSTHPDTSMNLT